MNVEEECLKSSQAEEKAKENQDYPDPVNADFRKDSLSNFSYDQVFHLELEANQKLDNKLNKTSEFDKKNICNLIFQQTPTQSLSQESELGNNIKEAQADLQGPKYEKPTNNLGLNNFYFSENTNKEKLQQKESNDSRDYYYAYNSTPSNKPNRRKLRNSNSIDHNTGKYNSNNSFKIKNKQRKKNIKIFINQKLENKVIEPNGHFQNNILPSNYNFSKERHEQYFNYNDYENNNNNNENNINNYNNNFSSTYLKEETHNYSRNKKAVFAFLITASILAIVLPIIIIYSMNSRQTSKRAISLDNDFYSILSQIPFNCLNNNFLTSFKLHKNWENYYSYYFYCNAFKNVNITNTYLKNNNFTLINESLKPDIINLTAQSIKCYDNNAITAVNFNYDNSNKMFSYSYSCANFTSNNVENQITCDKISTISNIIKDETYAFDDLIDLNVEKTGYSFLNGFKLNKKIINTHTYVFYEVWACK